MNDVCITNGVICMYKTVNLKTKLFTKLTNQNSYDEARAIGCIPGGVLDKHTDRDQRSWVFLNYPKNTLQLTEHPKNTCREAKP